MTTEGSQSLGRISRIVSNGQFMQMAFQLIEVSTVPLHVSGIEDFKNEQYKLLEQKIRQYKDKIAKLRSQGQSKKENNPGFEIFGTETTGIEHMYMVGERLHFIGREQASLDAEIELLEEEMRKEESTVKEWLHLSISLYSSKI